MVGACSTLDGAVSSVGNPDRGQKMGTNASIDYLQKTKVPLRYISYKVKNPLLLNILIYVDLLKKILLSSFIYKYQTLNKDNVGRICPYKGNIDVGSRNAPGVPYGLRVTILECETHFRIEFVPPHLVILKIGEVNISSLFYISTTVCKNGYTSSI